MEVSKTKLIDVQQNSPEWFAERIGRKTTSVFNRFMANYGKAFGDPAKKLAEKLAVERVTGERIEEFSNAYTDRGHEFEPFARERYVEDTFEQAETCGIFINGLNGCSPDGLVGDNGLIEIKTVVYNVQFERLRNGGYDSKYRWQIQGALWITGREWVDYCSYCPEMPENKQLYIYRVYPDPKAFDMLEQRTEEFELLINNNLELLK